MTRTGRISVSLLLWLFTGMLFPGCFEEDGRMQPLPLSYTLIDRSIYHNQVYFDLGLQQVASANPNDAWVLAFESDSAGWRIRVNSAGHWAAQRTGAGSIADVKSAVPGKAWKYDSSDGNPDSTAVGSWFSVNEQDTLYSGEVYLFGRYDGAGYMPSYKAVFERVTESGYRMSFAEISDNIPVTFNIRKDSTRHRVHFTFRNNGQQLEIEPPGDQWDILFTQYGTVIPDNNGVPTEYFVRGALINSRKISVAMDTLGRFADLTYTDAMTFSYSHQTDLIGYEWKDVKINEQSNTAVYSVRPHYVYLIRDVSQRYYKLHFTGFYNGEGLKGFPSFEYSQLLP